MPAQPHLPSQLQVATPQGFGAKEKQRDHSDFTRPRTHLYLLVFSEPPDGG
jgi:hypothetical protein